MVAVKRYSLDTGHVETIKTFDDSEAAEAAQCCESFALCDCSTDSVYYVSTNERYTETLK